jgi:hypothetical protein
MFNYDWEMLSHRRKACFSKKKMMEGLRGFVMLCEGVVCLLNQNRVVYSVLKTYLLKMHFEVSLFCSALLVISDRVDAQGIWCEPGHN